MNGVGYFSLLSVLTVILGVAGAHAHAHDPVVTSSIACAVGFACTCWGYCAAWCWSEA